MARSDVIGAIAEASECDAVVLINDASQKETQVTTYMAKQSQLVIQYKLPHDMMIYGAHPTDVVAMNAAAAEGKGTPATIAPFDTKVIEPGQSWELPSGAKVIRTYEQGIAT
ncbi:hypothetical protein [Variovorax sp. J22R115]|uniref:hypothetical protein n=1 Tax=Variovorax sp. J22R115 TaxID=3053509 RepID=UPI0025765066|nr:hypothetical protein [Variovorax sp. J22R115]MDM0053030.1 hypothetical protein [Variovorax sp. J22R115]